jgi:hypothetical protein
MEFDIDLTTFNNASDPDGLATYTEKWSKHPGEA